MQKKHMNNTHAIIVCLKETTRNTLDKLKCKDTR